MSLPEWITADRYHGRDSFIHRRDGRIKIIVTVAFAFGLTLIPEGHWLVFALMAALALLFVVASRLPVGFFVRRVGLALPFVLAALPLIFTRPGDVFFTAPLVGWTGSSEGIIAVGSILLKSGLAVLMAAVLVGTTQPTALLRALERLHVPRLLSSTIMLMYRYLFVIADEGQRMMRARDSRSASISGRQSGRSSTWRAGILGRMVGSLFLRSYERSERVHAAMASRGYDGAFRTVRADAPLDTGDWATLLAVAAALTGILAYGQF